MDFGTCGHPLFTRASARTKRSTFPRRPEVETLRCSKSLQTFWRVLRTRSAAAFKIVPANTVPAQLVPKKYPHRQSLLNQWEKHLALRSTAGHSPAVSLFVCRGVSKTEPSERAKRRAVPSGPPKPERALADRCQKRS